MKKFFVLGLLIASCVGLYAQQLTPIPMDSSVRYGVLPNGLTYYIRHNQQPKERCDFHIAQNVGSILEREDQLGLAHFLEHMAFNGSTHFPDKGIINYFEKIGVSFGYNINAYTSIDETVYRLSDVPTYREGIIDTALLTLYDWSCDLTLADKEIDKERGVIVSEWRTTNSAQRRMMTKLFQELYAGSQYANRMPIGDTTIIKNFSYQALRDYYHKWYGPDLQAIIVVGDIDVDKIEKKIKDLFSKAPDRKGKAERPLYGLNDNKEPLVAIITDKEATGSSISIEYKHPALAKEIKLSQAGYMKSLLDNLIGTIVGYRFEEMTADPASNIIYGGVFYTSMAKLTDVYYAMASAKEGKETEAYKDLLKELYKIQQHGFTASELERAKTDMLALYEKSYNERNTKNNQRLAEEYIRNFTSDEPIPGIAWEYEFAKMMFPMIDVNTLNAVVKTYYTDENILIAFQGPEKPEVKFPSKEEAVKILSEIKSMKFEVPKEETIAKNLIEKTPKAGKIKKVTKNADFGTTEWTLKNGVKVVFKPTEFKKDNIELNAFSWGGTNVYGADKLPSATLLGSVMTKNGLGEFSATDLSKVLAGKNASVSVSLGTTRESVYGSSSIKDFETMLQMIYLTFQKPRYDEKSFQSVMMLVKNALANKAQNPKSIFSDSLNMHWNCNSDRTMLLNEDMLSKVDYKTILEIYSQRFAAANDFTFVFTGNINPEDEVTKQLILTWLGSLKKGKTEKYTLQPSCHPQGKTEKVVRAKMEVESPMNIIRLFAPMEYNIENILAVELVGNILDYRYMESIREDEGGSYGVGVYGALNYLPKGEAILAIQFECDPDKRDKLMSIVFAEMDKLAKNGPSDEDYNKAIENKYKEWAENIEKNTYWEGIISEYYISGLNYATSYNTILKSMTKEKVVNALKQIMASGNVFEMSLQQEK